MRADAALLIEEPKSNLFRNEDLARPWVFLAGGLGITPFRSEF
jgi:ferredoxin-NADP reductase